MTSQITTQAKYVRDWFIHLIDYARSEYEKGTKRSYIFQGGIVKEDVTEEEAYTAIGLVKAKKPYMSDYFLDKCQEVYDFRPPCQIEIFWLKEPQLQLIVVTHFKERQDKEIIVNGPYDTHEIIDKVDPILRKLRWRTAAKSVDILSALINFVAVAKRLKFIPKVQFDKFVSQGRFDYLHSKSIGVRAYAGIFVGNIAEFYYEYEFRNIEEFMRNAFSLLAGTDPDSVNGYGVYFFPPKIVGKKVRGSLQDILEDSKEIATSTLWSGISPQEEKLRADFKRYKVVVNYDGFIFIVREDGGTERDVVVKILNTIMSIGIMAGLDLFAVSDHELLRGFWNYHEKMMSLIELPVSNTMRSMLYYHTDFAKSLFTDGSDLTGIDIKELRIDTLSGIINKAAAVFKEDESGKDLQLLIQSYTHIRNKDYVQSFILSWSILEEYLSELWKQTLNEKSVSHNRMNKLSSGVRWSVDNLLEVLNILEKIDKTRYDIFMDLKNKRNKLIHASKGISKEDTERCFSAAKEIVMHRISYNTK